MLVIHWSKQNRTGDILNNGIRPSCRQVRPGGKPINLKGVYVFPFTRNKVLQTHWKRFLKHDGIRGNYNGFVFRLEPEDFPLVAGDWFLNRHNTTDYTFNSQEEMLNVWGDMMSKEAAPTQIDIPNELFEHEITSPIEGDWSSFILDIKCFEIIIPRLIVPNRIIKIVKDREPKKTRTQTTERFKQTSTLPYS